MEKAIEIKDVRMLFAARGEAVHALEKVSFEAYDGEFISVVGPSGCGKTTLLRVVGGLIPPTRGQVWVYGHPVQGPHPNVGIVFQSPVLMSWRTVLDNVLLQAEVRKLEPRKYREIALGLIELVGIKGFENKYPFQLSGGMQQRVSICRALLHDPPLLLMDEPFGALDAFTREQMNLELMRIWQEKKKTVLFITHSIQEAVFLSDKVVVLTARPGRVMEIIPVELPRPRYLEVIELPAFGKLVSSIRRMLQVQSCLQ